MGNSWSTIPYIEGRVEWIHVQGLVGNKKIDHRFVV